MATGQTLLIFSPQHAELPATAYPQFDTRNNHPVLDYDADTSEEAYFSAVLPRNYSGGGITLYLHTAYSSATSGNCLWYAAFERIGDEQQDLDADGFATAKSATVTPPATSGAVTIDTIAFTNGAEIDSIAAGESFRLKIYRNAVHVLDTVTGDAELLMVELKET